MLIISKFRDYYDSALAGGVDKTIVYRRKQKKLAKYPEYLEVTGCERDYIRKHRGNVYTLKVRAFCVAFCGKLHYGMRVEKPTTARSYINYTNDFDYCYTFEEFKKAVKGYETEKNYYNRSREVMPKHFFTRDEPRLAKDRIIIAYSMPNKYGRCENITLNENLGAIKFYRVVDPYTALQEIMMYISGVIGTGEKDTIKISDKDMRDAKGFNEWSFKNPIRVKDLK